MTLAEQIAEVGRRRYPGVSLSDRDIVASCARRHATASVSETVAGDLFLALACATQDVCALRYFEAHYVPDVWRLLSARSSNPAHVDEVLQRLRATILTPRGPRPAMIADYAGTGPLAGWLRIAALRMLIRFERRERRDDELGTIFDRALPPTASPERQLAQSAGRDAVRDALRAAWDSLDTMDRLRLRVRYADGHGIDHAARLEGVHRATAARRLLRAEQRLSAATRASLRCALGLADNELDSMLRVFDSRIDLSLSSLFRRTATPETTPDASGR